ncbi:RNA-binding domain-containing protein [Sulfitobacter sp. M13]
MKTESSALIDAVSSQSLPNEFDKIFGAIYDLKNEQFLLQENVLLDYKENFPSASDSDYRSGLLKLFISLYNTYGGIVVFGVRNEDFRPVGVHGQFDIEKYNALLTDLFGVQIELIRKSYSVMVSGERTNISAVLVPKRKSVTPVRANRDYHQIKKATLYIRERHETKNAESHHLPLAFSQRSDPFTESEGYVSGIQYSSPPSPSTLPNFIGRTDLAFNLWNWFVSDRKPRIYLSGAGGSGKSTLAYEFLDQVALNWQGIMLQNWEHLDFALFVSAKETELNPSTGTEQNFMLRQFNDSEGLYRTILLNIGGYSKDEVEGLHVGALIEKIGNLFDQFNGLLVIDDIDSLSRSGHDTGEEDLFLLCSQANKKVKIIYTLRNDASYAKNSAIPVPGLDRRAELPAFLEECCKLFNTSMPDEEMIECIAQETSCLPLLVETIVGLRMNSSSYQQALRDFNEKGGDGARKYLYQREYEKLNGSDGRSRQILAALMEYNGKLGFDAIRAITNASSEQVRSGINETASIFLKISTDDDGSTGYSLSPSALNFVRTASQRLGFYPAVKRAVEHFRADVAKSTPREAAKILEFEQLLRAHKFDQIISEVNQLSQTDTIRVNPKFSSVLGQSYVQSSQPDYSKARELFQSAESFGYQDVLMMRAWFYAERKTGYRFGEAIEVCQKVANSPAFSDMHRSEFHSKIGDCRSMQSRAISGAGNPDKVSLLAQSITSYMWAMHFARALKKFDREKTGDWLIRVMVSYVALTNGDFGILYRSLEDSARIGLVIDVESANVFFGPISTVSKSRDLKLLRTAQGTLKSGSARMQKTVGKRNFENIRPLIEKMEEGIKNIELRVMQLS